MAASIDKRQTAALACHLHCYYICSLVSPGMTLLTRKMLFPLSTGHGATFACTPRDAIREPMYYNDRALLVGSGTEATR